MSLEDEILRSLRRISRAIDLHSRHLSAIYGLTGPQLVCLRAVGQRRAVTPGTLAREMSLSPATVSGIVDRLVARQLLKRRRPKGDRRTIVLALTPAGGALIKDAPSPLQEKFAQRLRELPMKEQEVFRDVLARVVQMMDGEDLDAAPIFGPITLT